MTISGKRRSMPIGRKGVLATGVLSLSFFGATVAAQADLVISSAATSNVTCSGGTCTATAASAVLNATALQTMLASGDVMVTTATATSALDVQAPLTWSSTHTLGLTGKGSIEIDALISINGTGGINLNTPNGGTFTTITYVAPGRLAFAHPISKLSMNGINFKLVGNIADLASAAAANQMARIALANSYNAQVDGTYSAAPVPTFGGLFDGLGNTISNLKIVSSASGADVGLFGSFGKSCERCGRIYNATLVAASVSGGPSANVGGLVGSSLGSILNASVTGKVSGGTNAAVGGVVGSVGPMVSKIANSNSSAKVNGGKGARAGGLIGVGTIVTNSYATGNVTGGQGATVGGLVGVGHARISQSFATGVVTGGGQGSLVGGLAGRVLLANGGAIHSVDDCYATGAVKDAAGGVASNVGGLIGNAQGAAYRSYSTGHITAASPDVRGGFVGADLTGSGRPKMTLDYWNRSSSGVANLAGGAGNIANAPGIKGLTGPQLKSALPAGFAAGIWAQSASINKGFPYLLANPPAP